MVERFSELAGLDSFRRTFVFFVGGGWHHQYIKNGLPDQQLVSSSSKKVRFPANTWAAQNISSSEQSPFVLLSSSSLSGMLAVMPSRSRPFFRSLSRAVVLEIFFELSIRRV